MKHVTVMSVPKKAAAADIVCDVKQVASDVSTFFGGSDGTFASKCSTVMS